MRDALAVIGGIVLLPIASLLLLVVVVAAGVLFFIVVDFVQNIFRYSFNLGNYLDGEWPMFGNGSMYGGRHNPPNYKDYGVKEKKLLPPPPPLDMKVEDMSPPSFGE